MKILTFADFTTTRWKNGGGITHEIAKAGGGTGLLWRLSIAEVTEDGPFSRFAGLARILTVIEGAGLALHTPDRMLQAKPLEPLAFSGDTPIDSRMIDGPVRDFNVIFDPRRMRAEVRILRGPIQVAEPAATMLVACCLEDRLRADGQALLPCEVGLAENAPIDLRLGLGATALLVRLCAI